MRDGLPAFSLGKFETCRCYSRKWTITGRRSEGRSQPRLSRKTRAPSRRGLRLSLTQTFSDPNMVEPPRRTASAGPCGKAAPIDIEFNALRRSVFARDEDRDGGT